MVDNMYIIKININSFVYLIIVMFYDVMKVSTLAKAAAPTPCINTRLRHCDDCPRANSNAGFPGNPYASVGMHTHKHT